MAKADKFKIPYKPDNINFLELIDQVEEFEETIDQASKYGIDWERFGYDILGIEDEISEIIQNEYNDTFYARSEFYESVRV